MYKRNNNKLYSGFNSLDKYTLGFQKKDLILVASRPCVGKTSFALNIANNMAKAGNKVAYFYLEDSAESLIKRTLAMESGISHDKLSIGQLSEREWESVLDKAKEICYPNIAYCDDAYLDTKILRNNCIKLKNEGKLDCIIIDYLQLMHCNSVMDYNYYKFKNRQDEITEILFNLKEIAKKLDVPIIVLYQLKRLNRSNDFSYNDDCVRSLVDVDKVLFLERKHNNYEFSQVNDIRENVSDMITLKVNIMKNKQGMTGSTQLRLDKSTTKLSEID